MKTYNELSFDMQDAFSEFEKAANLVINLDSDSVTLSEEITETNYGRDLRYISPKTEIEWLIIVSFSDNTAGLYKDSDGIIEGTANDAVMLAEMLANVIKIEKNYV